MQTERRGAEKGGKMKTLYMIGNAHLDPVWLWNWREGYQENLATLYSAVERLDEFGDVIFTSSSAQFYEWIEAEYPELFARIKEHIQKGRWVLCGGWWVQPDCNLPGGESFARHALLAQNWFYEKFGVTARVGYNVDSFGHNANIPAFMRQSGMSAYVFMRPGDQEKEMPGHNFIWEAPDGSRVPAFRIPFSYNAFNNAPGGMEKHVERCSGEFDEYSDHLMCFYGVGNHGGGPTIENINAIHKIQRERDDIRIIFESPEGYFERTKDEQKHWPVVKGDLLHHASGCYSAVSQIKEWCRRTEHELLRAEKFCVLGRILTGSAWPEDFDRGWKNLLFNQFHDIMAGSAIAGAYEDAQIQLGESRSIAGRNENSALQKIQFHIPVPMEKNMIPVTVFNPHGFTAEQTVEYEAGALSNIAVTAELSVSDSSGREIPHQFICTEARLPNRRRIAFKARVPALGYEMYRIRFKEQGDDASGRPAGGSNKGQNLLRLEMADGFVLENDFVKIVFGKDTGAITSYYSKKDGREYLKAPVEWIVCRDESDTWSHAVFTFRDVCGKLKIEDMWLEEDGPLRRTLITQGSYGKSTVRQRFILENDSAALRVQCTVDWHEHMKCLRIQFPLAMENPRWTCQIPFGVTERTDGKENPMQEFCDVTGETDGGVSGFTLYTDHKSSCDFYDGNLMLTALRSPAYACHRPYVIGENEQVSYTEQGIQRFDYAFDPHEGACRYGDAVRFSQLLGEPLVLLPQSYHPGTLPERYCGIVCSSDHVVVSALKRAQKGNGYVLRLFETDGEPAELRIEIPGLSVACDVNVKPHEILSFYIDDKTHSFTRVNFLEWEEKD